MDHVARKKTVPEEQYSMALKVFTSFEINLIDIAWGL